MTQKEELLPIAFKTETSTTAADINNQQQPDASFKAMFDMVMTNASAMHKHQIYNFSLTDISMSEFL